MEKTHPEDVPACQVVPSMILKSKLNRKLQSWQQVILVCTRVKPTRGYYVTTRGCAIEPKGSMSLPRSHYIIVGLCLLSCVLDCLKRTHVRESWRFVRLHLFEFLHNLGQAVKPVDRCLLDWSRLVVIHVWCGVGWQTPTILHQLLGVCPPFCSWSWCWINWIELFHCGQKLFSHQLWWSTNC